MQPFRWSTRLQANMVSIGGELVARNRVLTTAGAYSAEWRIVRCGRVE